MTVKEGLKKKLVDQYIQSGHNLIFFDELSLKDRNLERNQLSLDQEETPIILYKSTKENIVITSASFHFLDRIEPKKIRFNEIEEWRLSLSVIAERMNEKALSKREMLHIYKVVSNGKHYELEFATAHCGNLLIGIARQIRFRIGRGHSLGIKNQ